MSGAIADQMPLNSPADYARAIRDLQREITQLRAAQTMNAATVTGSIHLVGGASLQVDGGDVLLLDSDGSVLFRIGMQTYGDRGISFYRNDGSLAFETRNAFSPTDTKQMMRGVDALGKTIFGDSILSPSGMDAPHIPLPFVPVDLTSGARAQSTTSGTFVPLFEYDGFHQNPGLQLKIKGFCSDGTTAGEVQVWDVINSVYLDTYFGSPPPSVIPIPAGTTTATVFTSESMVLPGQMSDEMRLEIHVRRTAGTGTVSVAVARSTGFYI